MEELYVNKDRLDKLKDKIEEIIGYYKHCELNNPGYKTEFVNVRLNIYKNALALIKSLEGEV